MFQNFIRALTKTWTDRKGTKRLTVTREFFRRSTSDGHPMPTGTSFIPCMLFCNYVSPCLLFWIFMVCCAAYAAWTTPGLVKPDETCVKLTCLYQVRVFPPKSIHKWGYGQTLPIHKHKLNRTTPCRGFVLQMDNGR